MRVLDLFSGIGGFSLGLERAGFETVAFCEIEPYARQTLAKHWPNVPIHNDVRELDGTEYRGTVDLICGGYPCQPFSTAGKRRGQEDDRHLWPEVYRLLQEVQPSWFIGENVAGHISMGLDEVLSDLEGAGYAAQPLVIPAVALDAPHRRDRVWIIAYRMAIADEVGRRRVHQQSSLLRETSQSSTNASGSCGPYWGSNAVGATWETEPRVGRVADGIPSKVDRLKCLGNSVVPAIPELIGRAILDAHNAA